MTTIRIRTGAFACGGFGTSASGSTSMSPMSQRHGSGLPFAGYAALADATVAVLPTAVRTADAKVPDPRGRQR